MPIPTIVESEDQLPEGLAEHYEQNDDGHYVLSLEGIDSHPDVHGLKSSLQKQKQDREKLRKERDQFKERASLIPDDVEEETFAQVMERLRNGEDLLSGGGNDDPEKRKQEAAQVRQQLEQRYQKEIEQRDQSLQQKDNQVRQLVVDNGLSAALQKHGVTTPGLMKGAKRLLADQVKVAEDDNGALQAVVDTDMGEVSLDQFVKDWVSSEEGQDYLPKTAGSGARGAGNGGKGGKKEISREQFDQLDADARMKFVREGGKILD